MPDTPAPAAPPVPPTPPVPLTALLAREDLALRQIAGPSGPGVVVHWAHTSEMSDPYPYLLGGELLLTAGVHVPAAADPDRGAAGRGQPAAADRLAGYFADYVARIVAAGGAALGFGVAPVHDTVPRALVAACETAGLPLVEVPPRTTFSAVARAVWQLMAQARLAELRRVTEAQRSLASAAARPDPVPAVLRRLARHLGGRAVLYGPDGTEVAAAGRAAEDGVRPALDRLTQVVRPLATAARPASDPARPGPGPSARVPGPGHSPAPAAPATADPEPADRTRDTAAGRDDATEPADTGAPTESEAPTGTGTHVAAEAPAHTGTHAGTEAPTDTETHAEAGAHTNTGAHPVRPGPARPGPATAADTLGGTNLAAYALGNGQGFVLAVAAPRREAGDHTIASVAAVLLSLLTAEHRGGAGAARSSALVRLLLGAAPDDVAPLLGAGRWTVVHAARAHARPQARVPDAAAAAALGAALGSTLVDLAGDVVRVLVPAGREPAPQPGWTLGVSAPATPSEWPSADAQAARALARARATRGALVRHADHAGRPGLDGLVAPDAAEGFARALLAPLTGRPALAETLRTWLSLHGSWDRTAVALAVHRNTVRQRIGRCASLLGTDLDDPDVRMELWFALKHPEHL
ncbi:helix-turn-helix domain-containing protein [Streptomyces sp. MMS24-I2-30]|uniref:helix-turn-helix domain-containing protein n=1 Tax=Streptomyces sp. MMS24-I2-30 TaxID=3351564 RepID=UPI003896DC08